MSDILIIEDDKVLANMEKDYMEMSGFSVTIVGDGISGEKLALEEEYRMVILDVMLPGKDGFEVLDSIRADKLIPVIMVTARSDEADKVRALQSGADDYITKPFSPVELMARVRGIIEREKRIRELVSGDRTKTFYRGELCIDNRMHRVLAGDKDVALTVKEFELLSFLASHPGTVYTKEELFDLVWSESSFGDLSTVSVHVRKLRRKLEKSGCKRSYIETVWGLGYRFTA